MDVWTREFTHYRVPRAYNLRADPFERADESAFQFQTSNQLYFLVPAAAEPPFAMLHVVGPGGIGKTTLLQEAAELLDLPFNTYRYRLARGTERITEWLWRREIEGF